MLILRISSRNLSAGTLHTQCDVLYEDVFSLCVEFQDQNRLMVRINFFVGELETQMASTIAQRYVNVDERVEWR